MVAGQPVDRLHEAGGAADAADLPVFAGGGRSRGRPATAGSISDAPAFSADGKYLFFVSDRSFTPTTAAWKRTTAYFDMERIYFVTLAKETRSPFAPKSDEAEVAKEGNGRQSADTTTGRREGQIGQLPGRGRASRAMKVDRRRLADADRRAAGRAVELPSFDLASATALLLRQGLHDAKAASWPTTSTSGKETELGESPATRSAPTAERCWSTRKTRYAIIDVPAGKGAGSAEHGNRT